MAGSIYEWRILLESIISRRNIDGVNDWRKINRHYPYKIPGYRLLGPFKVIILLEASGFIDNEDYTNFILEINDIVSSANCSLHYILFRDRVVKVLSGKTIKPGQILETIKSSRKIIIKDALRKALDLLEHDDVVIVFTSGNIVDENDDETIRYADDLQWIATPSNSLYIYTVKIATPFKYWTTVNFYGDNK